MRLNTSRIFLAATLGLALASCGVQPAPTAAQAPVAQAPAAQEGAQATLSAAAPGQLQALGTAATTTLTVGQTRQLTVYVNGQPAQPGQLRWTTTNAAVVTVTQSGLVTAVGVGTATVRAALATNLSAYIDYPFVVQSATAPAPAPAPSPTPSTFAQRVLELTNQARAVARTCGTTSYPAAAPLTYNALLEKAAQGHATDMATKNYFSHTSLDGRTAGQRITAAGYTWRTYAENIAAGYSTPEQVVQSWLASAGHCKNIMNPALKELGVGYAYTSTSTYKHYWVQNFGAR